MAETIIERALLPIDQHGVGLGDLFELLFRVRIVGIAVGMVLKGELAVSALNLLLVRSTPYTQNIVVVAFSVAGQNDCPLPQSLWNVVPLSALVFGVFGHPHH